MQYLKSTLDALDILICFIKELRTAKSCNEILESAKEQDVI